jgi:hypothetical protein
MEGGTVGCPAEVLRLVERFAREAASYQATGYNETQARREFIDPLFRALGWDIDNEVGHAEAYKDVIHEDAIKVGGLTKAPDYCFRIGGTRKFFVEAKKPSVNIKEDVGPAFQLRRYAWSAKLPLSILTDFHEFAVYDCRVRPDKTDGAATARTMYVPYTKYEEQWDEIAGIFSKPAVLQGSFDRYADTTKGKRGTAEVDSAFLKDIEEWRDVLARTIALRNPDLTQRELNYAVQTTIDRIIFLRICEDRGIESYGELQGLCNGANTYARMLELFRKADQRYNSGLFHFETEKGRDEGPDTLTPHLAIDDKPLKDIIKRLYYPDSPYEFSVLPADILGQVYEQFLGKVIRLTAGHRAVVEDKPEVKKAGGVYYTPTYIVDYIVKNTVGKLLEGSTPKKAAELRILDPACGSGSFLIGAFQYLVDWHRDWYVENDPAKHTKEVFEGPGGEWRLTTAEKKRILLNNIYGVDIDSQAVETTKLSLLLKVLEGETQESINAQLSFLRERALPDLSNNIKCGNSLIGPDFYEGQQMGLLDDEERDRINVFDWQAEFPQILGKAVPEDLRGFDAVIGNPPYVRIQSLRESSPVQASHLKGRYVAAGRGNYDIYVVFVEKGLQLLGSRGLLGFILPNKFLNSDYGAPLRELLARERSVCDIVHFGASQVFRGATTYTCLLFLQQGGSESLMYSRVNSLASWAAGAAAESVSISAARLQSGRWNLGPGDDTNLLGRLTDSQLSLGDVAEVFVGVQTSADDVFIGVKVDEGPNTLTLASEALGREWTFERSMLVPLLSGTDVSRYSSLAARQYLLFPYEPYGETVRLLSMREIEEAYPLTAEYLLRNKQRLEGRENGRLRGGDWQGYIYRKNMTKQSTQKLCVPRLVRNLYAAYDEPGGFYLDNVDVCGIKLRPDYSELGYEYLLALINSRLLRWVFPRVSAPFRGGWLSANRQFISQVPIYIGADGSAVVRDLKEELSLKSRQMLHLQQFVAAARTPQERLVLERQFAQADRDADSIVYELYGLSDVEISMIEASPETAL